MAIPITQDHDLTLRDSCAQKIVYFHSLGRLGKNASAYGTVRLGPVSAPDRPS